MVCIEEGDCSLEFDKIEDRFVHLGDILFLRIMSISAVGKVRLVGEGLENKGITSELTTICLLGDSYLDIFG